jgi:hypothetical protein
VKTSRLPLEGLCGHKSGDNPVENVNFNTMPGLPYSYASLPSDVIGFRWDDCNINMDAKMAAL